MNIVGTPYSAVQRSPDRLESLRGSNHSAWINHGRAMSDATQVSHDHAEAVIQRHGNAHAVVLGQLDGPSTK